MRYKVGDRAKIREDLMPNILYGDVIFTPQMENYCGIVCTIANISGSHHSYGILEDNNEFYWSDEMLIGVR